MSDEEYLMLLFFKKQLINDILKLKQQTHNSLNIHYRSCYLNMSEYRQSQEQSQHQEEQARQIAQQMSTKDFFLSSENKLLQEWSNSSLDLFRLTGSVFMAQYNIKSQQITDEFQSKYGQDYAKCRKQFEAYCLLSRKVQKQTDQIENIAEHFNRKNTKKNFWKAWESYSRKMSFLRKMEETADKYHKKYRMKSIMKEWMGQTMNSNRIKIKNQVLHKTEIQISKIQNEYQKLIKGLEETLEKRLSELKKEEQQHRLLHNKYEAMYSRAKVNPN